ncbi:non-ribosomal peptide synthetase [Bailinhaonella thermotolerans]|uniref:non-ribosomal peptide synthetase n=1 Tax=Bailinhaonella thermotolerans TaxID=1070861 RepID=UPI00192A5704|nr:non-ribosomal peptide synthetase [Bailinhaonella thermotolerans]
MVSAFAEVAGRSPDHPAIAHDGRPLSYALLDAWARATAHRLGPEPGVVGVVTSRSAATVAGLLGVLAAGGTYCPIDPAWPEPRRRALLRASGCRQVLVPEAGLPLPAGVRAVELPPEPGDGGGIPAWAELAAPEPGEPAYILFTSGSTGEPKPVATPRRAIATVAAALRDLFGLTPADRVLQFASLNWDTSFEEIIPTLTAGATLVFHGHAHSGSFRRVLRMIEDEGITVLDLPSAYWHELVRHLAEERAALPACVRLVVIGGEAVSAARLADWRELGTGGVRLLNTYGCTETTLITHAADLHGPRAPRRETPWRAGDRVPIGHALPHVREHVTAEGELLVGGPALALGYPGLPEATAARFAVLDAGAGPERWFRTGDRVSRAPDGGLVHEGRLDHELKVRGIRVDPGEVEAHLCGHPGVAAAAVTGVSSGDHTTLVAYVVPRAPGSAPAAGVLAYLRDRVPAHLVPGRIAVVPDLVHTSSGKVDRAGTHRRHASAVKGGDSMNVDAVSDIFRRVLENAEVSADSDFFVIGGDSLLATRVLSAIARTWGVELEFDDFLDAPTPGALAKKIASLA